MKNFINSLITDESVVMVFTDEMKTVEHTNPNFNKIVELVKKGLIDNAIALADVVLQLQKHSSGLFDVSKDGVVYINAQPLPEALSKRILAFSAENLNFRPLINFWNNLKLNPSKESVRDLYAFMEHSHIPVTKDGCFIAYKRVRDDFKDLHSGQFDNTPGKTVKMNRGDVDADRNVTCSTGLHVAAYNYADKFYSNGQLLEVKVNPKDVVSVPVDYDNEKMRVCEYTVMQVCGQKREESLYQASDDDYNEDIDDTSLDDVDNIDDIDDRNNDAYNAYDDHCNYDAHFDAAPNDKVSSSNKRPNKKNDAKNAKTDEIDDVTVKVLKPDSCGRIRIPVEFTRRIHLETGDLLAVKCYPLSQKLEMWNQTYEMLSSDKYDYSYRVDSSGNVRISKKVFEDIGLANRNVTVRCADGNTIDVQRK